MNALFQPGYVGLGDAQVVGHLLLGVLLGRPQPEAQHHDGPLPGGEAVHSAAEHSALGLPLDVLVHRVGLAAQKVGEQQLVAVPVHVQGVVDGDLVAQLGALPQVHQDLVLDAPAGVGGQLDVPLYLEGVHRLDEPDGANGDQVLHAGAGTFKLFGDVHHQPQVVGDEGLPGAGHPAADVLHHLGLLLLGQGRGQSLRPIDVMAAPAFRREQPPEQPGQQIANFLEHGKDLLNTRSRG